MNCLERTVVWEEAIVYPIGPNFCRQVKRAEKKREKNAKRKRWVSRKRTEDVSPLFEFVFESMDEDSLLFLWLGKEVGITVVRFFGI